MTWNKHKKQLEQALSQSMRLLVLIRESLKREPGGTKSPLFEAVASHANLCGMLLPDSLRMSQAEIDRITAQLGLPPKEPRDTAAIAREISNKLRAGGMQVLVPDGKGGFGV